MGEIITIGKSVGTNGINLAPDVAKIGAALVAVGVERGGIFGVPLSVGGLGEAIRSFQTFQTLQVRDGKVDPTGKTLKRINEILNPGALPIPPIPNHSGTGIIRKIEPAGTSKSVESIAWSPLESSFLTESVFKWTSVGGKGSVFFFELDEEVVPNWFGVLVPNGLTDFSNIHIFFHPTPGQVEGHPYKDEAYQAKTNWSGVFHYLSDPFASQFCAANSNQVLIMPLMTQNSAASCGIFPQRWESIVGTILSQIPPNRSDSKTAVSSVVVSSFSSGITYSSAFRRGAGLGNRLRGIIDFDGIISTYKAKSMELPARAVRIWQTGAMGQSIPALAEQKLFPVALPRWQGGGPYKGVPLTTLQLHGAIPQNMMYIAARQTRVG
jgi:hypothetical protein